MNSLTTMIVFLGLTFTLIGMMFSLIVFCMLFYLRIKNYCIRKKEMSLYIERGEGEMEEFVKL